MRRVLKDDLMKNTILGVLFVFLSGCASTEAKKSADISSLPTKCGDYDVYYGVPQWYQVKNNEVYGPIMLNGKNMGYLDKKYIGKEVAVFTWLQVVGGLPMPDGSGGEAIYYYNPEKVLPLRREYNLLNRDVIEDTCRELQRKK